MATVYILESKSKGSYYIGSCKELTTRLEQHESGIFKTSFTSTHKDWLVYYKMDDLGYEQSRKIESHIKRMKSRKYIENLKKYPEIMTKLKSKYYK